VGEDQARELLEAWRVAGGPLAGFCRDRGVPYSALYKWRRRMKSQLPVLLEVKVVQPARAATYEVVVADGRLVRVGDDFDGDVLVRLVATVERSC
jgi:hypothetical protein